MDDLQLKSNDLLPTRTYVLVSVLLFVLVIPYTHLRNISPWKFPHNQIKHARPLPRLHMIVRGYSGDSNRIFGMLLPSIEAFYVFRESDSFTFVFDNESSSDHVLGNQVLTWASQRDFPITIKYADSPSAAVLSSSPYKSESGTRIAGPGYTRQLYDTFWFDTFIPVDSLETDIIGILDPDAPFIAPFVLSALMNVTRDIVIKIPVCGQDGYPGDSIFLGSSTPYNSMVTGAMPQLFYVKTFRQLRQQIKDTWSVDSFDKAWLAVFGQTSHGKELDSTLLLSPANVLANFALTFESGYSAVSTEDTDAMPVFASNKGNANRAIAGCCRTFQLPFCTYDQMKDWKHVTQTRCNQWSDSARIVVADDSYHVFNEMFDSVPLDRKELMRTACMDVKNMTAQWSLLSRR